MRRQFSPPPTEQARRAFAYQQNHAERGIAPFVFEAGGSNRTQRLICFMILLSLSTTLLPIALADMSLQPPTTPSKITEPSPHNPLTFWKNPDYSDLIKHLSAKMITSPVPAPTSTTKSQQ